MDGRKEVEALVREARSKGWMVTHRGHGFSIAAPGMADSPVYVGSTPSDSRAIKNTLARLRRRGWDGPPAEMSLESQVESLEAELAGVIQERDGIYFELQSMIVANDDLAAFRKEVGEKFARITEGINEREVTIAKLREQVEGWRQKWNASERMVENQHDAFKAVMRAIEIEGDVYPGIGEVVSEKIKNTINQMEMDAVENQRFGEEVLAALDSAGAPLTEVTAVGVRSLSVSERIDSISGGADAAVLRVKLRRVMGWIRREANEPGGIASEIEEVL